MTALFAQINLAPRASWSKARGRGARGGEARGRRRELAPTRATGGIRRGLLLPRARESAALAAQAAGAEAEAAAARGAIAEARKQRRGRASAARQRALAAQAARARERERARSKRRRRRQGARASGVPSPPRPRALAEAKVARREAKVQRERGGPRRRKRAPTPEGALKPGGSLQQYENSTPPNAARARRRRRGRRGGAEAPAPPPRAFAQGMASAVVTGHRKALYKAAPRWQDEGRVIRGIGMGVDVDGQDGRVGACTDAKDDEREARLVFTRERSRTRELIRVTPPRLPARVSPRAQGRLDRAGLGSSLRPRRGRGGRSPPARISAAGQRARAAAAPRASRSLALSRPPPPPRAREKSAPTLEGRARFGSKAILPASARRRGASPREREPPPPPALSRPLSLLAGSPRARRSARAGRGDRCTRQQSGEALMWCARCSTPARTKPSRRRRSMSSAQETDRRRVQGFATTSTGDALEDLRVARILERRPPLTGALASQQVGRSARACPGRASRRRAAREKETTATTPAAGQRHPAARRQRR